MKNYLCASLMLAVFTSVAAAEPSLKEARQLWLTGNYDEAREQYEKLAGNAKNQPAAAIGVSLALQSQGEYDKALAVIDDAAREYAKSAPLQRGGPSCCSCAAAGMRPRRRPRQAWPASIPSSPAGSWLRSARIAATSRKPMPSSAGSSAPTPNAATPTTTSRTPMSCC